MSDHELRDRAVIEAGQAAVRLLKNLAAITPLRSDSKKIWEEISRIETVFGGAKRGSDQDGFDSVA